MGNHGSFSFGGTKGLWIFGSPLVCFHWVGSGKVESWDRLEHGISGAGLWEGYTASQILLARKKNVTLYP